MNSQAAINASPLIYLSKANRLDLLHTVAEELLVPRVVLDELGVKEDADGCLQRVLALPSVQIVEATAIPEEINRWDLGAGESAVLALALARPGCRVVIDDLLARRCAEALGLPLYGTLGLVLRARRAGRIDSAADTLRLLRVQGMYLSDHLIRQALALVGEDFE